MKADNTLLTYLATPPTITAGNTSPPLCDPNGSARTIIVPAAGRIDVVLWNQLGVSATTTSQLLSFTTIANGVANITSSYQAPATGTFSIDSITISCSVSAASTLKYFLVINYGSATAVTAASSGLFPVGLTFSAINTNEAITIPFPAGLELPANTNIGMLLTSTSTTTVTGTVTIHARVYV